MVKIKHRYSAVAAWLLLTAPTLGHVHVDPTTAAIGKPFHVSFKVGHGCSGSPTIKLRVQIPEGVLAVVPEAAEGWKEDASTAPYEQSYPYQGASVAEGVREVSWTRGASPNKTTTFTLNGFIAETLKSGTRLYFPVVQQCEVGVERWIERGGEDQDDHPAPVITLQSGQ